jgi:hypothetical protein
MVTSNCQQEPEVLLLAALSRVVMGKPTSVMAKVESQMKLERITNESQTLLVL